MKLKENSSKAARDTKASAAFSLVEVMVAVLVIGIAFVAIFGSMTMGLSVTQLSRENLRATQILIDKMEGLRLYNWTQINDTNFLASAFTNWFYETNSIGQSNATGTGVQYIGTVAVGTWPYTTAYTANMRKITVTINWTSGRLNRTRSMVTYVGLSGLQNYVYNN